MSDSPYETATYENDRGETFRTLTFAGHPKPNVLLFVHHGLGEHGGRYAAIARALADVPVRVFAFDVRGHGESTGKQGHAAGLAAFAADVPGLLAHARKATGLDRVIVMGHSMGAAAVLEYVTGGTPDPSIEGLILSAPPLKVPTDLVARIKLAVGRVLVKVAPTMTMPSGLDPKGISSDPAEVARYEADPLVHDLVSTQLGLDLVDSGPRLLQKAGRIKLPTLLYHGTADPICDVAGSRLLKAGMGTDDLVYKEFSGLCHETHHEVASGREAVFAELKAWLTPRVAA